MWSSVNGHLGFRILAAVSGVTADVDGPASCGVRTCLGMELQGHVPALCLTF